MKHNTVPRVFVAAGIVSFFLFQSITLSRAAGADSHELIQGWKVSTPEEQGMDSETLVQLMKYIYNHTQDIHSILIIRNGSMVVDAYFFPYQSSYKHALNSCTKSFTSALVGIAIDKGYIKDTNQYLVNYFQDMTFANKDTLKKSIQLKHLLTMTSGIDWPQLITKDMDASPNWVQFILDRSMVAQPGSQYNYSNGDVHLLSAIISRTTKKMELDFGKDVLFTPLGISDLYWATDPQGNTSGCAALYLKPTDMAKLGYLYLNKGKWDTLSIVTPGWVSTSLQKHSYYPYGSDYGFLWWLHPSIGVNEAWGSGGQHIAMLADLNMVVVMTGGYADYPGDQIFTTICRDYITPAVKSSLPLPANVKGKNQLDSLIQKYAQPPDAKPVPALPQQALTMSDKIYEFDANPLNFQSASLHFQNDTNIASLTLKSIDGTSVTQIGLDDVYRINPTNDLLYNACKGYWQDARTFIAYNSITVNALKYTYTVHVDQSSMDVRVEEPLTVTDVTVHGTLLTTATHATASDIKSFHLDQNYPNPFNPSTTISYSIAQRTIVSLKVLDVLGREIATLEKGMKDAGTYRIQYNGSSLAGGVYFFRMQAGNYVEIKKGVLLK